MTHRLRTVALRTTALTLIAAWPLSAITGDMNGRAVASVAGISALFTLGVATAALRLDSRLDYTTSR